MRLVLAAVLAASLPLALVAAPAWQTPAPSPPPSSPGTAAVGKVGYAIEGKIDYLFNPDLRGKDPGQFVIRAFPLP